MERLIGITLGFDGYHVWAPVRYGRCEGQIIRQQKAKETPSSSCALDGVNLTASGGEDEIFSVESVRSTP